MPRIIVAEDDEHFQAVIIKAIEHVQGIIVGHAKNGDEALQLCRSFQPDWLFTDYNMPKINGLELVQRLRSEGFQGKAVVISNSLTETLKNQFREQGVDNFFNKSYFEIYDFIKWLERAWTDYL